MFNPLLLLPGAGALLNWRAHRRQDHAHDRHDADHEQMKVALDLLLSEIHQPPPAFPERLPHYAPSDAEFRAERSKRGIAPAGSEVIADSGTCTFKVSASGYGAVQ